MVIKKDVKENFEFKNLLELNSLLKIVSILFILSITVLAIVNIFERKEKGINEQNVIVVTGRGELNVKPDTTKFTISVTESGKDIKSSQDSATNKINAAIVILKQNGVLDKNIKTLNFNTYPKYGTRTANCSVSSPSAPSVAPVSASTKTKAVAIAVPPTAVSSSKTVSGKTTIISNCVDKTSEIVGYETNQSIEVKITDINSNPNLAGILVSAVGKVGVQTSGLTNYVDDLDKTKQIVRELAIQKAKVQAQEIAKALGVKLVKITSFTENSGGGAYPYAMMSSKMVGAESFDSVSLPVGEDKITSDVSVTYSIK